MDNRNQVLTNKSSQSIRETAAAIAAAESEKLVETKKSLSKLKLDFARRDTEAKEAEERIRSMS